MRLFCFRVMQPATLVNYYEFLTCCIMLQGRTSECVPHHHRTHQLTMHQHLQLDLSDSVSLMSKTAGQWKTFKKMNTSDHWMLNIVHHNV